VESATLPALPGAPALKTGRAVARWIELVSWFFVAFGLLLPFVFHSAAFSLYRDALVRWAYGADSIAPADHELFGLMLGITGGSIAGKWIVHALLARGPLAEGRPWARDLSLRGLGAWFILDSVASLAVGATFNVWMINLLPLALVGMPLTAAYRSFDVRDDGAAGPGTALARACRWTALFGASTGLVIAFGGGTPAFALWFRALELAQYAGASIDESTRRAAMAFFGPIGGCTFAQFVMLAGWIGHDRALRRPAAAGAVSIAAWFAIDSGYGLASAGLFNILMINVPALAVTLPPWAALCYRQRQAGPPRAAFD